MKKYISYIYVILSAVCWGFIGFSNRLLTGAGVSLGNRVFIRNFGTLLVLTVVFGLFHRQVFRIRWKHLPIFLGSGLISILLLSIVYFKCQTMCSLSVAAVLLYLAPSFVVIFSAVLWKTPLTKRKVIALVVSLLGCVMVSGVLGVIRRPRGRASVWACCPDCAMPATPCSPTTGWRGTRATP